MSQKLNLAITAGVGLALTGAGILIYGALVEANRLVLEPHTLPLPGWPEDLRGYRIAVLADFHLRERYSRALAERAVALALAQAPDMVVLTGDVIEWWRPGIEHEIREVLAPLQAMKGSVVAIPGNHDHIEGKIHLLEEALASLDIPLLRNESWQHDGITWLGIDSARENLHDMEKAMEGVTGPAICLWHEPDMVDTLKPGCHLMLSGHSHGGQFRFPGGFTPMHTKLGEKYPRGFYPNTPTPLYVSRGIGTTGYPSRLNCDPEVSLLTLIPG